MSNKTLFGLKNQISRRELETESSCHSVSSIYYDALRPSLLGDWQVAWFFPFEKTKVHALNPQPESILARMVWGSVQWELTTSGD